MSNSFSTFRETRRAIRDWKFFEDLQLADVEEYDGDPVWSRMENAIDNLFDRCDSQERFDRICLTCERLFRAQRKGK